MCRRTGGARYPVGYGLYPDYGACRSRPPREVSGGSHSHYQMCTWRHGFVSTRDMEVDGQRVTVEAAVSGRLPVPVLLGKDVPIFDQLLGSMEVSPESEGRTDEALVVVTRAQARRNLEEELLRREKELLARAKPNPVEKETSESPRETETNTPSPTEEEGKQLSKDHRRTLRQQCAEGKEGAKVSKHPLEISAVELKVLQDKDETLVKIRRAADGHPCSARPGFFRIDGLLYRRWTPPGRGEESAVEQLVLPQECDMRSL